MRHLICVDVETNGLDPDRHQAVEVAWWNLTTDERGLFIPRHSANEVLATGQIEALRLNRYIDRIALEPQDYHLTRLAALHTQFVQYDEDQVSDDGEAALTRHTLAGTNPGFDARFLTKLFLTGDDVTDFDPAPWHHRMWDLSAYAAGVLGIDELPGLARVCELLDIQPPDHTAEGDVTATGLCFRALMAKAGRR